jgi:hypothetical protein
VKIPARLYLAAPALPMNASDFALLICRRPIQKNQKSFIAKSKINAINESRSTGFSSAASGEVIAAIVRPFAL